MVKQVYVVEINCWIARASKWLPLFSNCALFVSIPTEWFTMQIVLGSILKIPYTTAKVLTFKYTSYAVREARHHVVELNQKMACLECFDL